MTNVTLQTIADKCGVSRTTASNAFSRPDQLSDELRETILETARRLGYSGPHAAARTLRRGKAGAIGVVLKDTLAYALRDTHAVEFLAGVAEATADDPTALTLIPTNADTGQGEAVFDALVDGFLLDALSDDHPAIAAVFARQLPVVIVDGPRISGEAFVGIDDRAAMKEMTQLVLGAGHTQIVVMTLRLLPDDYTGPVSAERLERADFVVTRERLAGVHEAGREEGVDIPVFECAVNTRTAATAATATILNGPTRPTAIICMSDQIALGVIDAATNAGLTIPEDLTVTGFDDIPQAADVGLTTVHQSGRDKGMTAVQLLQSASRDTVTLPYSLAMRNSVGPPPE